MTDFNRIKDLPYSSGLMSQSSWFVEFKKIVQLWHDGKTWEEIRTFCVAENYFGAPNENRAKRMYGYLKNRIAPMDEALTALFLAADLKTQKLINLMMFLVSDKLFFEFVNEVYREKIQLGQMVLEDQDGNVFISRKEQQHEEIAGWADKTKKRLCTNYYKFMTDAGLLKTTDRKRYITPPILDIALEQYLQENGGEALLRAITGVI